METWEAFKSHLFYAPETQLMLDWNGMGLDGAWLDAMEEKAQAAQAAMQRLDAGAVVNVDEGRMVGHYWLRAPELAPTSQLQEQIRACIAKVKDFAGRVHRGELRAASGKAFQNAMVVGIGGSSLGPVFVDQALASPQDKLKLYFIDNTDPDGMDRVFNKLRPVLDETLVIVISKSGGTIETRNGMEEARAFYTANGLDFAQYAVCVTGEDSKLDQTARKEGWMEHFPMWDWVGGRTSVMSAVGLLPLALKGIDIDAFLQGAADCDALNRRETTTENPAMLLALSWYRCSGGQGGETMVVLPYKDSLELFAKYLQQLVMESLGKELDLDGKTVHQGLAVLGNKGSSDQHSYVQQLVAGPENIFVVFVQVLRDRQGPSVSVGEESTSGDYLNAFLLGTKQALESHGKRTMTLTIPQVDAYQVGQLIALFERAVGIYASLVNINAYHQPAVEFGKKAAGRLITMKNQALALLREEKVPMTAQEIAQRIGGEGADLFRLLLHLAYNREDVGMSSEGPMAERQFFIR